MSKFAAWKLPYPYNQSPPSCYGIRLQVPGIESQQQKQFIGITPLFLPVPMITPVDVTSFIPGWYPDFLTDKNPDTVWSSQPAPQQSNEAITVRFGQRTRVNFIDLTPRMGAPRDGLHFQGKAMCFPQVIEILQRNEDNTFTTIMDKQLPDPGTSAEAMRVPFPQTYTIDGLKVVGKQLRPDQYGVYYFQLAEFSVGYRTIGFSPDPSDSARANPTCLFALGDEPNSAPPFYWSPDEYAYGYDRFVEAVKTGSSSARVSPGGFILRNPNDPGGDGYAEKFYEAKTAPVDEWRFHHFYYPPGMGNATDPDYLQWAADIPIAAKWSIDHGAPMVLGSFGSPFTPDSMDMREYQKKAMQLVLADSRIVEAVWWTYDFTKTTPAYNGGYHSLLKYDGSGLTLDGELFVQLMKS